MKSATVSGSGAHGSCHAGAAQRTVCWSIGAAVAAFALACSHRAADRARSADANKAQTTFSDEMSAADRRCELGHLDEGVSRIKIEDLVSSPQPYYGRQVVVRGYFVAEGVETTALLDPGPARSHVLLSIRRLPVTTAEQLSRCRRKLVDVEGYVTHVPSQGGEALIVFGEAMVGVGDKAIDDSAP